MAHLPSEVEVILCAGPEGATRDFDDFSTTEHLIALGRAEASEIVRRYGLGTIPYPAPPLPVPDVGEEAGRDVAVNGAGEPGGYPVDPARSTVHSGSATPSEVPVAPVGSGASTTAAADPVTQPDPGT